ncbi:MAG: hypothetical protein J6W52_09350 [Bacteroidaceae bacterium]|nr:hypothetical protein [Bacteroidaceae bacterium]
MAEMKQDMYGAVGRIGNKTYYQRLGKTIGRTITKPKNPKTENQSLQRVLMKTVIDTYTHLKVICNHTFEDYDNAFECMNKFKRVNMKYLREHADALLNSGQGLDRFYQFAPIEGGKWTPFAAIISEGHLPQIAVGIDAEGGHKAYVSTPGPTYADFATAWNLQRGDLLTFVTVQKREGKYEVRFARLVLDPRYADGSGAPMTTEIVNAQGEFPCPNKKNELNFSTFEFADDHFNFVLGRGGDVVAAGIIVSRENESGNWLRSNCQLVLNEAGFGPDLCSLAKAVEYSYKTPKIDIESELYLDNADANE